MSQWDNRYNNVINIINNSCNKIINLNYASNIVNPKYINALNNYINTGQNYCLELTQLYTLEENTQNRYLIVLNDKGNLKQAQYNQVCNNSGSNCTTVLGIGSISQNEETLNKDQGILNSQRKQLVLYLKQVQEIYRII